jgi:hypothetical protein
VWQRIALNGERFDSWLRRVALEALTQGRVVSPDRRRYRRITFVYEFGASMITLVTVMDQNHKSSVRYGNGGSRRVKLAERDERMLVRGARLARGEDPE